MFVRACTAYGARTRALMKVVASQCVTAVAMSHQNDRPLREMYHVSKRTCLMLRTNAVNAYDPLRLRSHWKT